MKAGIIGANGYGGAELIRFLQNHPKIELNLLVSNSTSGKRITEQYPHLTGLVEIEIENLKAADVTNKADVLFFAAPAGIAKDILPEFLEKGMTCIDLSGDFRLKNPELYEKWYRKSPAGSAYISQAVYGLPEMNREKIKNARLIANPGCYPTAASIGLLPAIQSDIIDLSTIIIDAKSGVSGAGRSPSAGNLFSEVNENLKAYKVGEHQHVPEIEQTVAQLSGRNSTVLFTPHLVPMTRGILCTMYASLTRNVSLKEVEEIYQHTYENEPFVRVRQDRAIPATKDVYGTNFCDIGLVIDERTNRLVILSVIDNLVKGAAGQAVQNMNLIYGWKEDTGLRQTPVYP